eukprot:5128597-Pleurochrysis_carterae.AAC.1
MPPNAGVMNRVVQPTEDKGVRRIGKSSDPDHPFHPCDDVNSDDPVIEAMLESSSSPEQSSTKSSEIDYDPAYPYRDPYERVSPRRATTAAPQNQNNENCIRLVLQ